MEGLVSLQAWILPPGIFVEAMVLSKYQPADHELRRGLHAGLFLVSDCEQSDNLM